MNESFTEEIKIADLLGWSRGKRVETRKGPRMLREAAVTPDFWDVWRSSKQALKDAGISISKDGGNWVAKWWEPVALTPAQEAEKLAEAERRAEALELSRATYAEIDLPLSEDVRSRGWDYLGYQKAGIRYALDREAVLIGDEMGLGKTIQGIGIFNADETIEKVLVVCPASLRLNWKKEFERWATRPVRVAVVQGGGKTAWPKDKFDVLVVNYDVASKHKAKLDAIEWDLSIFDEAHLLKNPKAQRTVALFGKKESKCQKTGQPIPAVEKIKARRRVILTGTPIANRPVELFPIVNFLDPEGLGKDFFKFATRYCDAKRGSFGWDFKGASNLDELQEELRGRFMIRRLKSEVLKDLPDKRRQVISIPANGCEDLVARELEAFENHREVLDGLAAFVELAKCEEDEEALEIARENLSKKRKLVIQEMTKLRQEVALAKVPSVIEHVEDALTEGPVILFAHHKAVVEEFMSHFGDRAGKITGDVALEDRQKVVEDFQAGKIDLFVGNIQAAGVGLTLTRSAHVVFAELDWVPGNMTQAEDRAHRIGQKNAVLVQHIVLEDSLDERLAESLITKQDVIDRALDVQKTDEEKAAELEAAKEEVEVTRSKVKKVTVTRDEIDRKAKTLAHEQIGAAHRAMKRLAGICDGAKELDGMGFSGCDVRIGHSFAGQGSLSARQAVLAIKLCQKYRRQLDAALVAQATGETVED